MELGADTLEALLHAAPDALIAVDEQGIIVYANDQTEQLFGWPKEELAGSDVEMLVPERFKGSVGDALDAEWRRTVGLDDPSAVGD